MTYQQVTAARTQILALVCRIESGDAAAHEEMLHLVEQLPTEIADGVGDLLDRAAAAHLARQEAEENRRQQDAVLQARPLTVAKAAVVMEQKLHRPEASTALRGIYRAVEDRNREDLEYVLETLNGLWAFGRLKLTLEAVAERAASILLELQLESFEEANELFAEARQAHGLRRTGLMNRAKAARREGRIFFPGVGLAAIERLILKDQLPEAAAAFYSTESLEALKEETRPATGLLKKLSAPPEREDSPCEHRTRMVMHPGKTARDKANARIRAGKMAR